MAFRYVVVAVIGIVVSGIVGVLAWLLSPENPELWAAVFATTALPFGMMMGWIIVVAPTKAPTTPHGADSVESSWLNTALAGTATDIVLVVGLSLTAVSIARVEFPTQLVLLGVLLVAFGSTATRYGLARIKAMSA